MIKSLTTLAALTALSFPAFAADLPARSAAPVFTAAHNWGGSYVGVAAGVSVLGSEFHDVDDKVDNENVNGHRKFGFTGGLYGGYNFQVGNTVIGFELAANFHNSSRNIARDNNNTDFVNTRLNWYGSAKLRAGLGIGNSHVYIGVGPAVGGFNSASQEVSSVAGTGSDSAALFGAAVAAGAEHMMSRNTVLRVQAEYVAFGRQDFLDSAGSRYGQTSSILAVTAGAAYKF